MSTNDSTADLPLPVYMPSTSTPGTKRKRSSMTPDPDSESTPAGPKRPKLTYPNPYTSTIIHILVGSKQTLTSFHIHREIFAHASPYFRAAFTTGFIESTTAKLHLPEEHPAIFAIIASSIYKSALQIPSSARFAAPFVSGRPWYIPLYISLDKYRLTDLATELITSLRRLEPSYFTGDICPELVEFAFQNTVDGSPLRELLLDMLFEVVFKDSGMLGSFMGCFREFPGVAVRLATMLAERARNPVRKRRAKAVAGS